MRTAESHPMSIKPSARMAARKRSTQGPSRSFWWPVVRNLFATLQEVPMAALSALSVMAGAAVVHRYCMLIGYGPEASVSIGFGAAVALVVLLGLVSLWILLQAPGSGSPRCMNFRVSASRRPCSHSWWRFWHSPYGLSRGPRVTLRDGSEAWSSHSPWWLGRSFD